MARILVIDDDVKFRQIVAKILVADGHEVAEAGNGRLGLKALATNRPFDLIITDIIMPDMEGIETIRNVLGALPTMKIIAMSGSGEYAPAFLDIAKKFGVKTTLSKPFGASHLRHMVAETLRG